MKFRVEVSTHRVEVSSNVLRLLRFAFEVEVRELYMRASMSMSVYSGINVSIVRPDRAFHVGVRKFG